MQWRARKTRQSTNFAETAQQRRRSLAQTEQQLIAILERDPEDPRAYVSLGTLYQRNHQREAARKVFEEGCRVAQGASPHIWTALGQLERQVRVGRAARPARVRGRALAGALV